MSSTIKIFSANYVGECFGVIEKTTLLFMHKVKEVMKSCDHNPMFGNVNMDSLSLVEEKIGK